MTDRSNGNVAKLTTPRAKLEQANVLRALAMDAVEQANSGHPGAPMGMAEMAVALWGGHLRHNPGNPQWADRDRFVLSNGHGSMLLYSLLHLTGYDLPIEQLKRFRQLHSLTPGHPEYGLTPGVETTTGPLGQGLANAVGFALAEKRLADEFNRGALDIVNHHTYVFVGDGCLMEGISHEACSLAGTLKLGKLIVLYDDNGISIDGDVTGWFTDDTEARFSAYGWQVTDAIDGHDVIALGKAICMAKENRSGPTLIRCRTTIGKGSPTRQGTARAHGEPLGHDEIEKAREAIDWPYAPFEIPDSVYRSWKSTQLGSRREAAWQEKFATYEKQNPELAREFVRRMRGEISPEKMLDIAAATGTLAACNQSLATRKASQQAIEELSRILPELIGGSADLSGSNLTTFPACGSVRGDEPGGRYIHYGVREFAMAAIMNGLRLHGGYLPYGGTFLTFSDYSRSAIRMAALMKQRVIHVFTHDSVGLGEDGPTHQPIEHAASLRLIPGLDVWRPADQAETALAWTFAVSKSNGPTALLLSRQSLPAQHRNPRQLTEISRGAYVLSDRVNACAVILATGSEVGLAMQAQVLLDTAGVPVRIVSMPSSTVFDRQDPAYKTQVLGRKMKRFGVEAGSSQWWYQYGCCAVLGIDRFGESGPAEELFEHFGLTPHHLADLVKTQLKVI